MLSMLSRGFRFNLSKFCQMRFNSLLFGFLPFSLSRAYLRGLGALYFLLKWQEKRLIQRALTRVWEAKLSAAELKGVIKETFQGIIDHYHEKLFIAYSRFKPLLRFLRQNIKFSGEESLQEALAGGKGVLLVTGHFGAVEFLPAALALNGYPVSMICRFQTNRLRDSLMERGARVDIKLIDADEGNVFISAAKELKSGRIVITECDEFDEWRESDHFVHFLGSRLRADRTLDILKKRSGAAVVTALLTRAGRKRYTLNLTPIPDNGPGAAAGMGAQCLGVLEEAIQASPEQWYQWKKFGQLINVGLGEEVDDVCSESGYLAPEIGVSVTG
jgi:KDO2-lipid IV(A) lauroyltransferase